LYRKSYARHSSGVQEFLINIKNYLYDVLDSSNNAYIVGRTSSLGLPVTPNAFQSTNHGGNDDAFLTELTATSSSLIYSSYLGGSGTDQAAGVAVDTTGDVYVTGATSSYDFPTTPGAFQQLFAGIPVGAWQE
jgi:hypothetical protein